MARRHRRNNTPLRTVVVRRPLPLPPRLPIRPIIVRRVVSPPPVVDRRSFHPMGKLRPLAATVRSSRRLVVARNKPRPLSSVQGLNHRIGFAIPRDVKICVQRKQRREVILARGYSRKGAGAAKRRNIWSDVKC